MNTPAHLLIGAAAFGRGRGRKVMAAALLGALAPDASLYIMALWALHVQGIPPQVVFDELYFSPTWQSVFAIDNSFFLWGLVLGVALLSSSAVLIAFAGAALLHLATDFVLHAGDGRPQFWPLTDWVFDSPVSYWDSTHHALWVAPLVAVTCCVAFWGLWHGGLGVVGGMGFGLLLAAELWTARQWFLFF
ncbi:cobalamin biosynthesis protein CobQ [Ruegeria hyattellae]|uniref:cobalamin biosynthesis protein CobQ n=1 Tax=Ruegeria hyattellae TaxID=3233337 RepID=UPI00355C120F